MKRRVALAIVRDLRRAERIVEDLAHATDPAAAREAEQLIAGVLVRLLSADADVLDNAADAVAV